MARAGQSIGLGNLSGFVLSLVLIGIISAIGLIINSELDNTMTVNGTEYMAIQNSTQAISNITSQLPLIGTIIIFGVVLFLAVRFLGGAAGGV